MDAGRMLMYSSIWINTVPAVNLQEQSHKLVNTTAQERGLRLSTRVSCLDVRPKSISQNHWQPTHLKAKLMSLRSASSSQRLKKKKKNVVTAIFYLVAACVGCVRWGLCSLQWYLGGSHVGWRRSFQGRTSCWENIVWDSLSTITLHGQQII